MSIKKVNEIFGYGLFIVGALKILLVILLLIQVGTNITAIFNGGSVYQREEGIVKRDIL